MRARAVRADLKRWRASLVVASVVLSGCVTSEETPVRVVTTPPPTEQAAEQPSPSPELATVAPAAPPVTYPKISSLSGLAAPSVEDILGPPQFRRRDKPAELWQYRGKICVIDLFLYPAGDAGLTVDHIEVRSAGAPRPADQDCFVSLLKEREAEATPAS